MKGNQRYYYTTKNDNFTDQEIFIMKKNSGCQGWKVVYWIASPIPFFILFIFFKN